MVAGISQNELVYRAIKAELVDGRYMPGQRLESRILSERHSSSSTPVRMALSRLVGERIVEMHANDGFHVPMVTEESVRDIYLASKIQIENCLQLPRAAPKISSSETPAATPGQPVTWAEQLFLAIAKASGSRELTRLVENLNDRTHYFRTLELRLGTNLGKDVHAIQDNWQNGDLRATLSSLGDFHGQRIANANELVKLVYLPRKE